MRKTKIERTKYHGAEDVGISHLHVGDFCCLLKIMNKPFPLSIFLSIILFFFTLFAPSAYATITPYLITEPMHLGLPQIGGVGHNIFTKYIQIFSFKHGDKLIVSANPDGTGDIKVADELFVTNVFGEIFRFATYTPRCKDTNIRPVPPTDISYIFDPLFNLYIITFADWCGREKDIGSIYLVHIAPTPTPTSIPGPAPFLDLPWDYEGKGLTFNEAALNPFSWFDHQYPLQNECCSPPVLNYAGEIKNLPYHTHNGYDYGLKNGVALNTPVLAAASGIATFKSAEHSGGAGNVIKIEHGNGYQTWYEHLSKDDLIVSTERITVSVAKGQMIGRVGMTGNTSGPHIHFSVFKDANANGTFDDDYPYGVVDPLGWEGEDIDPWTEWSDGVRTGTKSFNLFIPRKTLKSNPVPTSGALIAIDDIQISVPSGALSTDFTLSIKNGPFEFVSDTLGSIVPSFFLDAVDSLGQKVTQFLEPIQITYSYKNADLFNINEDTLKLYFFNDQTNQWEALSSIFLDKQNKTIIAETTHFSQFSLMGEVKDKILPTTNVVLSGDKGQDNWYRSSVTVELNGQDNENGVGLQYTLYTINGEDWFEYKDPLIFENEGTYNITYQSSDKAENTGKRKTITFNIDKTPPESKIFIDQEKQDLAVEGLDQNQISVERLDNTENKKKDDAIYIIADQAGNTVKLDVRDRDKEKKDKFKIYSVQYNQNAPIVQPDNHYNVKYKERRDKLNVTEQTFEIDKEIKIKIKYDSKKNQSTIVTKVNGEEKTKEIKEGLILLQLTTEKGRIKYSY